MFRSFLSTFALLSVVACADDQTFTYRLDAEIVIPAEVAATLETPALVEVEWMDETHGVELICDPLDGELRTYFSGEVHTLEHVSHQSFIARVVPWPADQPCDPELIGTFPIQSDGLIPYHYTTVFPDDAEPLGLRERVREEFITVVVGYEGDR